MADLYYDRYEGDSEHRKAGYTKILAKAGYVEQSAEFNEVQSIARDYIERLGDSLYREGYIVAGCGININGTSVTIESGRIYLEGLVRLVNGVTLTITGQSTERIVAKVLTTIVTPEEDRSLYDPAQNAENYGLPGADRMRQLVQLKVVQGDELDGGVEIYHLEDGVVVNQDSNDENAYLMDILAERTFDENGSYKVTGLMLKERTEYDESQDKVKLYVTSGKAYVNGYSVNKPYMVSVFLDPSRDTRTVTSESHYYNSQYDKYELSNGPIADVRNLTCLISVVSERKFRGSTPGGYDSLNYVPVDSISRVYTLDGDGNIGTVYKQNRDYKLYNDNVDWSLTGDEAIEPTPGTTYYVDYVYNKTMVRGVDYEVENSESTAYIKFLPGGDKPNENSRMYISYDYTLARRDLILLDQYGHLSVIQGKPDRMRDLITPYNGSNIYLELGYVDIYPTDMLTGEIISGIADVYNYNSVRLTQEDFYTMLQRIDTLEDDMATLDMERDIEEGEDVASLNGYFTDGFKNINRSDLAYTHGEGDDAISYTACIDYDMRELTTAADIYSKNLLVDDSQSDEHAIYGTIISAPYVPELAVRQRYATGTMLVNPYASYGPLCKIILTPDKDNWVDTRRTEVYNTENRTSYSYDTKTYSHGYWSRSATKNLKGFMRSESTTTTSYTGTSVYRYTSSSVASSLIEYMRPNTITVEGIAFVDNMRNIYCKFNGIPINITPIKETVAGDPVVVNGVTVTTVNPNENGHFDATIEVPVKVPCGKVNVTFTGINEFDEENTGTAIYEANGTLLTVTVTNTTVYESHYNVLTVVDNLYKSDPLAELFVLDDVNDRVLIKLGLYFATKSPTRPAVLQIRNVVNGYPGEQVYAEVTLYPEMVNLPTNPNVPVVTEVVLNQPVYCVKGKQYCFVILSDSNAYSVYVAEMGKNILGTEEQLIINPYGVGVLFSSSNATTWTAHQTMDMKFELYKSRYTGNGEIIFDEADIDSVTGILLDAAYQDTDNVGLEWYYRYKMGNEYSEWFPTDTLVFRDLRYVTDRVMLKAIITTDFSTSPFIDVGRVSLRAFIDQKKATYISTHITEDSFEEPYQELKISYEAAMPQGADHVIYYMDTYDGEWVEVEAGPYVTLDTKRASEEFIKYTWNISKIDRIVRDPTSEGAKFFKMRIDLTTNLAYNRPRIRKLAAIFKYSLNN